MKAPTFYELQRQGQTLAARLSQIRADIQSTASELDATIAHNGGADKQAQLAASLAGLRTLEAATQNAIEANEANLRAAQAADNSAEGKARQKRAAELAKELTAGEAKIADLIGQLYEAVATATAHGQELRKLGGHYNMEFIKFAFGHADRLMAERNRKEATAKRSSPEGRERARQASEREREQRARDLEAARAEASKRGTKANYESVHPYAG